MLFIFLQKMARSEPPKLRETDRSRSELPLGRSYRIAPCLLSPGLCATLYKNVPCYATTNTREGRPSHTVGVRESVVVRSALFALIRVCGLGGVVYVRHDGCYGKRHEKNAQKTQGETEEVSVEELHIYMVAESTPCDKTR